MSSSRPKPVDAPNDDHKMSCDETGTRLSTKSPTASDDSTPKKPDFSYNALIIMALKSSPDKKLTLHGIYNYIKDNFTFYRTTTINWKNCISYNLSMNIWFIKIKQEGPDAKGAGCYWMLDEKYEDEMLVDRCRWRRRATRAKKSGEKASRTSVDAPIGLQGVVAPVKSHGVTSPYLPTPSPTYTPNAFFGVGAPMPVIPTPMLMPPINIDLQLLMHRLLDSTGIYNFSKN